MAQYPHIRVFYGSDGLVHFMSFTDAERNGQYSEKHIGQGLIDFVELDLSKYRLWLAAAKSIPLTMEHYQEVRDAVYDVRIYRDAEKQAVCEAVQALRAVFRVDG